MGILELRILGPLEALVDGRPVALGGPKQRALLAMLLLQVNEVVSSERLIEEIWTTSEVDDATRSLRVYVSSLRKALGECAGCVETRTGGYALVVDPLQVDANLCEQLAGEGRRARIAGDHARAAALFTEALDLWRGPPLADLTYESVVQVELARLEELRISVLEERIDADLALGRHAELVAELQAVARQHPLRERLRGQLMLALYRSGRQHDALDVYNDAYRLLRDEFGLEPTRELQALQTAILNQEPALVVEPAELQSRRHLPAPATPLIGRRREVGEICSLLHDGGVRLLTLSGPGGVGKTRLALQAAHELAADFVDGVYFVELAPLQDPGLVVSTIATALGTKQGAGSSLIDSVKHRIAERKLLLLVDNFEHVDVAAPIVSELMAAAGDMQLIVTSRSRLQLYGEHEYRVPPLPVPDPVHVDSPAELAAFDSIDLFATRALANERTFQVSSVNARAVAELCVRLDGLPLAIELAAARIGELSPERMLTEIPLTLAGDGPRDAPGRHRTLRGTIEWSERLLSDREQQLFRRLAVFAGGCSRDAATVVCEADRDGLTALIRASLLQHIHPGTEAERFSMLETIRAFATERLDESADAKTVRRRHVEYFLGLVEGLQPLRDTRLDTVESEHDNVRAALAYCVDAGLPNAQLRLCVATWRLWYVRGLLSEGSAHLQRALHSNTAEPLGPRAAALRAASVLAWAQGDYSAAESFARSSLDIYTEAGDEVGMTRALISLGLAVQFQGDLTQARAHHERCRMLADKLGLTVELGAVLANLGDVSLLDGDADRAGILYSESLEISRRTEDIESSGIALLSLGVVSLWREDWQDAAVRFAESLLVFFELRVPSTRIAAGLTGLAASIVRTDAARAVRLLGAASVLREGTAETEDWWEPTLVPPARAAALAMLGDRDFEVEFARGRASHGDAIRESLGVISP